MDIATFMENLEGRKNLAEDEVKNLLKEYDIPTTRFKTFTAEEDISKVSVEYPIVMKVCSPTILHKTDVKGVVLNIGNEEELIKAFTTFRKRFPNEKILVENMESGGLELIMGIINDDSFGLSIMVGLGGVFAEALKDVSFRVIPIARYDAKKMLEELKGSRLLSNYRGMKVDKNLVIDILLKLSKLGQDFGEYLSQMDLNPVIIREKDAVVVDAKMILG
ncbi:MAG: acetate--CoA ligase family protein [Thermoplasmata archaeon]